ncbi:MAG: peptidase MA family metallohydrolase [Candidatus Zixiibacteriota bacterium]
MTKITVALLFFSLLPAVSVTSVRSAGDISGIERAHFVYYFENHRYIDPADSVLNRVRLQLQGMLGDTLPYKPSVYLFEDLDSFDRLLRGRFPDWGAAAAIPERGAIVIKSPDKFNVGKSPAELLAHEYAHLVVGHCSGFYSVPRWFDEGVAMLVSTEWTWSDNVAMSKAAVFGEFMPLHKIDMVNRFNRSQAQVAYAQSYLAVKYLIDNYGSQSLARFLDQIAQGAGADDALLASCGATCAEFEEEFQDYLRARYNVVTLFTDTMFFWLALAVIVLIGVFLRYRKRRQYYKRWEQEEALQSTDFDYGDPAHPEKIDDEDEPWRD